MQITANSISSPVGTLPFREEAPFQGKSLRDIQSVSNQALQPLEEPDLNIIYITELENANETLIKKITDIAAQQKISDQAFQQLNQKTTALEQAFKELNDLQKNTLNHNLQLKVEIDKFKTSYQHLSLQYEALKTTYDELNDQNHQLTIKTHSSEKKYQDLENNYQSLNEKNQFLKSESIDLKDQYDHSKAKYQELEKKAQDLQSKLDSLKDHYSHLQKIFKEAIAHQAKKIEAEENKDVNIFYHLSKPVLEALPFYLQDFFKKIGEDWYSSRIKKSI
jgi:chromosome segregation ATPase